MEFPGIFVYDSKKKRFWQGLIAETDYFLTGGGETWRLKEN